jgi:hypothetical protein
MSAALRLYEQPTEATDDKTRARLIAEAFDALETRFPQLSDLATQGHVRESELRLQKEIREIEASLQKKIKALEVRLTQAIHRQTLWVVGAVGAIVGLIRVLEAVVK